MMLSESFATSAIGAEPEERMKTIGIHGVDSLNALGKSNGGTSRNFRPSLSSTMPCTAAIVWSVRSANIISVLSSGLHFILKLFGHSSSIGVSESKIAFQPLICALSSFEGFIEEFKAQINGWK